MKTQKITASKIHTQKNTISTKSISTKKSQNQTIKHSSHEFIEVRDPRYVALFNNISGTNESIIIL